MRRKVANPLALAVLAYLLGESMHPYELGRQLKEHGKDRSIRYNRGSLYMVVGQLRKAGFVRERESVHDSQRPERTVYEITDEGRQELYDWMRDLISEPGTEYPHFGVALSLLSVLPPDEAVTLLDRRLAALTVQVTEVDRVLDDARDSGVMPIFLVEEDYRRELARAEQRFVTRLIDLLNDPTHVTEWKKWVEGRK